MPNEGNLKQDPATETPVKDKKDSSPLLHYHSQRILNILLSLVTKSQLAIVFQVMLDDPYSYKTNVQQSTLQVLDEFAQVVDSESSIIWKAKECLHRFMQQEPAETREKILDEVKIKETSIQNYLNCLDQFHTKVLAVLKAHSVDDKKKQVRLLQARKKAAMYKDQLENIEKSMLELGSEHQKVKEEKQHQEQGVIEENQQLQRRTTNNIATIRETSNNLNETENSRAKKVRRQLEQQLHQLQHQLEHLNNVNMHNEKAIRKQRSEIESEVKSSLNLYDNHMFKLQNELELLQANFSSQQLELNTLKENLVELNIEYEIVMEEKRQEEERIQREQEELRRRNHAATVIQSAWRGYCLRQKLLAKVRKGRGKGRKAKTKRSKQ